MMLLMLLLWVAPVALLLWALGAAQRNQRPPAGGETPLDILRRRYANGEISQEEFERAGRALA